MAMSFLSVKPCTTRLWILNTMETLFVQVNSENHNSDLNHQIDTEVQRIFRPLNLIQVLLLNPKYHTKNNFIHPNNCFNNFILIIGLLMFTATYTYHFIEQLFDEVAVNRFTSRYLFLFMTVSDMCYRNLGFFMNFLINLSQTYEIVSFVLHFQEVHRFLDNKTSNNRFIVRSWICVLAFIGFYLFTTVYLYLILAKPAWNVVFYMMGTACFDANSIYLMRTIKLLTDKTVLWNTKLLFAQKNVCNNLLVTCLEKLFRAYNQILCCYQLVTNIYQIPVSKITIILWSTCFRVKMSGHTRNKRHTGKIRTYKR